MYAFCRRTCTHLFRRAGIVGSRAFLYVKTECEFSGTADGVDFFFRPRVTETVVGGLRRWGGEEEDCFI